MWCPPGLRGDGGDARDRENVRVPLKHTIQSELNLNVLL